MARYLDENGLALLINNYLKPEDEYSLSSEHPVQNKVLTQTFGNLLSIIDYSKVTGYFHYANAAALPTVNSTGQEEGDFEYNPEKQLKIGQRAILDDTQTVMEITAIDSETGAITWTDTGLSFGGQVIQVNELPTASAEEEDKIYQYVGATTATLTNGFFYKCISDGETPASYEWINIPVQEDSESEVIEGYYNNSDNKFYEEVTYLTEISGEVGKLYVDKGENKTYRFDGTDFVAVGSSDTIQVEALPTAGASEVGKIYQYIGETNLSFTNGYFYECVEDSGSYSWVEKEVQKNANFIFTGTSSEWESETSKTDYQVAILTDQPTVNAVDSTDGSTTVVANKNLVFKGTLEEWEALTTAEKKAYDEALITDDGDTGNDVYSTTETKTNKVWIDGKPIYRKIVDIGTLPNASTKSVNHGISSLESVVRTYGMAGGPASQLPLPFVSISSNTSIQFAIVGTTIDIITGVDRSAYTGWVAIEYTKTTD